MLLFFVEMWERFSYYGMRAILILYLVNAQQWSVSRAASLYGTYTASAYITPLLGGYLADRFLGTGRSLVIGGIVIALGHFSLAFEHQTTFFLGLTLVAIGTGLFKPNVSTMVGQLYRAGDPRRDAGFTIFFTGINIGSLLAPLVCGYLGQRVNWSYGFAAAGVGMVFGLILYLWGRERYLPGIGQMPLMRENKAFPPTPITAAEWRRMAAVFLVCTVAVAFWACYEQAGSSLTLFTDRHIDRNWFGFDIPASWFQAINPTIIIVCAPLFALLWKVLGRKGREPSTPAKMTLACLSMAVAYVFLIVAGVRSESGVLVSAMWLVSEDTFRTWAELLLSPVGLSYVTKVAPERYGSRMMAVWFLSYGLGNKVAGVLAAYSDELPAGRFFATFVGIAILAALVLALLIPLLKRLAG
jgi:POT family proton-dependent oligopeptide transporter